MERALGLRLLDRSRNGIEATSYGRALVKRGLTVIFDELAQGLQELEFLSDPAPLDSCGSAAPRVLRPVCSRP